MATRIIRIALLLSTALVVSCAAPTAVPTQSAPSLAPSPAPTIPASQTLVDDNANGKSITIQTGARLKLVLHSTYWEIQGSSDPKILIQLGEPRVVADTTVRIPGTGAGTVSVEFQAIAPGNVDITASRTACGEALRCAPDQASFKVTVTIR
jgi:hypothetical protein